MANMFCKGQVAVSNKYRMNWDRIYGKPKTFEEEVECQTKKWEDAKRREDQDGSQPTNGTI